MERRSPNRNINRNFFKMINTTKRLYYNDLNDIDPMINN